MKKWMNEQGLPGSLRDLLEPGRAEKLKERRFKKDGLLIEIHKNPELGETVKKSDNIITTFQKSLEESDSRSQEELQSEGGKIKQELADLTNLSLNERLRVVEFSDKVNSFFEEVQTTTREIGVGIKEIKNSSDINNVQELVAEYKSKSPELVEKLEKTFKEIPRDILTAYLEIIGLDKDADVPSLFLTDMATNIFMGMGSRNSYDRKRNLLNPTLDSQLKKSNQEDEVEDNISEEELRKKIAEHLKFEFSEERLAELEDISNKLNTSKEIVDSFKESRTSKLKNLESSASFSRGDEIDALEDFKLDAPKYVIKLSEKIDVFYSELNNLIPEIGHKMKETLASTNIDTVESLMIEYEFQNRDDYLKLESLLNNLPNNVFEAFKSTTDMYPGNSKEVVFYHILFGLAKNSFGGGTDRLSPYIQRKNPLDPRYHYQDNL